MIELYHNNLSVCAQKVRIVQRPSYKAIADYPPTDYDDTGRDGLKHWQRIKQLIAA